GGTLEGRVSHLDGWMWLRVSADAQVPSVSQSKTVTAKASLAELELAVRETLASLGGSVEVQERRPRISFENARSPKGSSPVDAGAPHLTPPPVPPSGAERGGESG
ncbi:MAG: hypothetical protein AAFR23_05350, partial [Pseudomonadota bacterium]